MKSLIVEDDLVSRMFLKGVLSRYGECQTVLNGKEAVEAIAAASGEGHPFDLVCMDIMMPEMDGQTALAKIREFEHASQQRATKVIMTTALGDRDNVAKACAASCDGYLLKPIRLEKLLQQMRALHLIVN
jgi:two-component system chemotaxis response regulator CheY